MIKSTSVREGYDTAVHSDFLIHWTGKDFDDPAWAEDHHNSQADAEVEALYLNRLHDIVTYGLWMTEEKTREVVSATGKKIIIPSTPQCCFTELKLSQSRKHAQLYGRLGIGVKRRFLFDRLGRPLAYFGWGEWNFRDRLFEACAAELGDQTLLNFFKPMNSTRRKLNYDLYSECEWRILFLSGLLAKRLLIDPRDSKNVKEYAYFMSLSSAQQARLKYLIPLDGWFSMIIYPSIGVKNAVHRSTGANGVRAEIERIKRAADHGNRVEKGNWPIELDLDACRHF